MRHIAVENHKLAVRAATEIYPDAIHHRDIREFSRAQLHADLAGVHILFVLVVAGFPCQGFTFLNALRQGFEDERAQLFFEALRVLKDVRAEKHRLEFLLENVATMSNDNRDRISSFLGVRPVAVCSSGISQVKRRRYLWASWPILSGEGVSVSQEPQYWNVKFTGALPNPNLWAAPGWELAGPDATRLPTFVRALPKTKPTYLPAGIATTPPDARQRWRSDSWRYPPTNINVSTVSVTSGQGAASG